MDLTTEITLLIDKLVEKKPPQLDSVQLFIDQHLVPDSTTQVTLGITHRTYLQFCSDHGYVSVPMRWFPDRLREKGLEVTHGSRCKFYVRKHKLV
jgi:hypothetical protein